MVDYVTAAFPPTFITGGNADPLTPQSKEFADRLAELGVPVEPLFYPDDQQPALGHEYQFDLTGEAGNRAFEKMVRFLQHRTAVVG